MKIIIIGGGDIASNGIIPTVGGKCISANECDIRNYDQVLNVVSKEKPDVVICTAGVSHVSNILESDIKLWEHEIHVNLLGSYYVAKASAINNVKTMIFMASVAGLYGKPNHSGYSVSKSGVITLVQSLSMEKYNAYAISAGRVDSKMREKDFPNEDPKTRLSSKEVGRVIKEILNNKHKSGDNIIIRKRGYRVLRRVDKGGGWAEYLKVGQPPVV
jgi:NAD(P)-dependent dehydrogenase (short-subunit alcohol dehydrogenase family)